MLALRVFLFLQPRSSLCFTACLLFLSTLDKASLQLIPCSCGKDSQLNGKTAGALDCITACKTRVLPVHPTSATAHRLHVLLLEPSFWTHYTTKPGGILFNIASRWSAIKSHDLLYHRMKCHRTRPWFPIKMDLFPPIRMGFKRVSLGVRKICTRQAWWKMVGCQRSRWLDKLRKSFTCCFKRLTPQKQKSLPRTQHTEEEGHSKHWCD